MVKVSGKNMPISFRQCYEIANFIRGKQIDAAIKLLGDVIVQKRAVPYRRYNMDICHKAGGVGPGRYPKKASEHLILLLKNLRGQAQDKGLDTNKLYVIHAAMQKGAKLRHYGRKLGTVRKNTHFELVGKEMEKAVGKKDETKGKVHEHAEAKPKMGEKIEAKTQGDSISHGVKK